MLRDGGPAAGVAGLARELAARRTAARAGGGAADGGAADGRAGVAGEGEVRRRATRCATGRGEPAETTRRFGIVAAHGREKGAWHAFPLLDRLYTLT